MNILKLVSILLFSNNYNNLIRNDEYFSVYAKREKTGNDDRYNNIKDVNFNENIENFYYDYLNITMLNKIKKHIINKNIIEELERNDINIQQKIDIIEKYTDICEDKNRISEFNLFAGGLLNQFYDT